MVLGKRSRATRPTMPRKRRMLRKPRIPRPVGTRKWANNGAIVSIKRRWYGGNWVPNTTTTNDFFRNINVTLSGVPSNAEFVNLFDFYRISGFKVELVPRYDSFAGNDTTDTTLPGITNQAGNMVHYAIDPYNFDTPAGTYVTATLNPFLEKNNVKTLSGNRKMSFYVSRPGVSMTVGGSTGGRTRGPWISTGSTTVPHYGVQIFLQDVNLTGTFGQAYDIFYTAYCQFKGIN